MIALENGTFLLNENNHKIQHETRQVLYES